MVINGMDPLISVFGLNPRIATNQFVASYLLYSLSIASFLLKMKIMHSIVQLIDLLGG